MSTSGTRRPGDPGADAPEAIGEAAGSERWRAVARRIDAPRKVIDRILAVLCVAIFTALVLIVGWQVFSRQVLPTPASWTEETARYVFVVLAMFGSTLVFSERGHIAVELLASRFRPTVQRAMAVAVELTVVFFALFVLVYGGLRATRNAWGQNISTMPVSVGQIYLVLPVAGVLITYFAICHLVGVLAGEKQAVPEIDEANQGI
ncbi:TRAP transporter small permease [Knoellia sp. CPCC 206435]|uniref:TRAP transporter small permease n=1 Tax=Knoellia terrae TaxID=3404797 RepID=UPI003B428DD5